MKMMTYDTAGQSAEEMMYELQVRRARVNGANAIYYRGAIEMVALGHGTARLITRSGTSLLWALDDESILVMDTSIETKIYKSEDERQEDHIEF